MVYLQRWYGWCHMKLLPSRRVLCTPYNHVTSCKATYVLAWTLCCFHSLISKYPNRSEGADSVGRQLRRNKECPFSGVTCSGRVWKNVPEHDTGSVSLTQSANTVLLSLLCVCVRARTRACCVRACVRACVRMCVCKGVRRKCPCHVRTNVPNIMITTC